MTETDDNLSSERISSLLNTLTTPEKRTLQNIEDLSQHSNPNSKKDFLRRLETYKSQRWFAKPSAFSPTECAKFGWINIGIDLLQCETCKNPFAYSFEEGKSEDETSLQTSHEELCPWRKNCCPSSFVQLPDNYSQIHQDLEGRVYSLSTQLLTLPNISQSYNKEVTLLTDGSSLIDTLHLVDLYSSIPAKRLEVLTLLAICGWEGGHKVDTMFCACCRRTVGMWNFDSLKSNQDIVQSSHERDNVSEALDNTNNNINNNDNNDNNINNNDNNNTTNNEALDINDILIPMDSGTEVHPSNEEQEQPQSTEVAEESAFEGTNPDYQEMEQSQSLEQGEEKNEESQSAENDEENTKGEIEMESEGQTEVQTDAKDENNELNDEIEESNDSAVSNEDNEVYAENEEEQESEDNEDQMSQEESVSSESMDVEEERINEERNKEVVELDSEEVEEEDEEDDDNDDNDDDIGQLDGATDEVENDTSINQQAKRTAETTDDNVDLPPSQRFKLMQHQTELDPLLEHRWCCSWITSQPNTNNKGWAVQLSILLSHQKSTTQNKEIVNPVDALSIIRRALG